MKLFKYIPLLFLFTGCTQWKRLIGDAPHDEPASIAGIWRGNITLDGREQNITLDLIQQGSFIGATPGHSDDHSFLSIDYSGTMHALVTGSVSGTTFNLKVDNGSLCPNKFSLTGEVFGSLMVATFKGDGNNVPGTVCYKNPINQTLHLGR